MIELFNPKQIRCEHCGFEFVTTGFGSAAKIVCLACGEEAMLPLPKPTKVSHSAEHKSVFPEFVVKPATESLLCSVEQCPLLTGNEAGSAIAEQVKLRLRKKAERRRTILAWTVMFQVCVLISVALFVMKPFLIPDESSTMNWVANTTDATDREVEPETDKTDVAPPPAPPVYVAPPPLPAVPEIRTAEHNESTPPFAITAEPEHAVSIFEMAHHVFPPLFDSQIPDPVVDTPSDSLLTAVPEHPPVSTPPAEAMTLEKANSLLESAKTTLTTDPENSVRQVVLATKMYEELGHPLPDSLYWIMGNAFASLSWGESLLESAPAIETMALSANNQFLIAQLRDKTVWVWDLQSPEDERAGYLLDRGTTEYVKFVFSPDLRWVIGGQKNGLIRIWDINLKYPARTFISFVERLPDLQDLQISPDGHWLAAFGHSPPLDRLGAADSPPHPVLLWNLRQMEVAGIIPMATAMPPIPQPIQMIRFSPHSDRLAIVSKDAIVRIYDLLGQRPGNEPLVLKGHQLGITQIAFAPNGQWIATGSQDNTVRLWNLTDPKDVPESTTLFGHVGWISALTIDRTGEYILSGSYDRTIRIWNINRNRITAPSAPPVVLKMNMGVPESLSLTRDGDKMIVLGNAGSLGIYHLPSLLKEDSEDPFRAVTFRNHDLSISQSLLTTDDQLLIFSYEHVSNPLSNGIRLWALQSQPSVQ